MSRHEVFLVGIGFGYGLGLLTAGLYRWRLRCQAALYAYDQVHQRVPS